MYIDVPGTTKQERVMELQFTEAAKHKSAKAS